MSGRSAALLHTLKFIGKGAVLLFVIPVLGVWAAGSFICTGIAMVAGMLGLLGWERVTLSFRPETVLPQILVLPFSILLAAVLLCSHIFTRRMLRTCLKFVKS
ncbi:hypothetical protein [Paenibacillus tepidiphilus]|uniref:hypothetical protein n=1 Tax=Paenibacillus tepidiphilus TaxID=2608683 RepID=UPI001239E06D|nr:hypothetical protein [Paenibacillus tepidiphilus]